MFPVFRCSVIVCSYYILLNFYFQLIPPISFISLQWKIAYPGFSSGHNEKCGLKNYPKNVSYSENEHFWAMAMPNIVKNISSPLPQNWLSAVHPTFIPHNQFESWFECFVSKHQISQNHPSYLLVNPVRTAYWLPVLYPAYTNTYNPSLFAALLTMKGKVTACELREDNSISCVNFVFCCPLTNLLKLYAVTRLIQIHG